MDNKNYGIKVSTIVRIFALVLVLANQIVALFGDNVAPFFTSVAYQVVTAIMTLVVVLYSAWKNNDITILARIAGRVFSALKDGEITTDEVIKLVEKEEITLEDVEKISEK